MFYLLGLEVDLGPGEIRVLNHKIVALRNMLEHIRKFPWVSVDHFNGSRIHPSESIHDQ